MRDVIVFSTWSWDVFNVPERIALALAMQGARVLYCEMPVSRFRRRAEPVRQIHDRVYNFGPEYLGKKFSAIPGVGKWQWRKVAYEIQSQAETLGLKDPVFLYSHVEHIVPLCNSMRAAGMPLVHVCMDYPEPYQYELVEISDRTLVISKAVFAKLRAKYADKIGWIPQSIHLPQAITENGGLHSTDTQSEPAELSGVPRPRLGYWGTMHGRVNLRLVRELLERRPDWHFVCFGDASTLHLPNAHSIPWIKADRMPVLTAGLNVGVMPYDCFDEKNLHSVPLKIFDYFLEGIPVVSTPVISLGEFGELVYFADTSDQFVRSVEDALAEPLASPNRRSRKEVALAHATVHLGVRLQELIDVL